MRSQRAGCSRAWLLAAVFVSMLGSCLPLAAASSIDFRRDGPYELCVDEAYLDWVQERAELVVNEDPRAGNIDDAAVAAWTVQTMERCRKSAGPAGPGTDDIFGRHMARWRQHIYDLATNIRRRGQSD